MPTISPAGIKKSPARLSDSFTLVELLVVVAIMGILAAVAAVSLRGLRSPAVASAANEVASAMKMTRQMAITRSRTMYVVVPISENVLTTNLFRAYAIFEEVRPGQTTSEPDAAGNYFSNNVLNTNSFFIPKTDWRFLPEGAVFCNLATGSYSSSAGGDALPPIGVLTNRINGQGFGQNEWRFFESFTDFDVRHPREPQNQLALLRGTPYLAFNPSGQAVYGNPANRQGAAFRIMQGYTRDGQVAVTDTNLYYQVETDPNIGRVRVRTRESFAR